MFKLRRIRRFLVLSICSLVFYVFLVIKTTNRPPNGDGLTMNVEVPVKKEIIFNKKHFSNTTMLANNVVNDYLQHISSLSSYYDSTYKLYLDGLLAKQPLDSSNVWDIASERVSSDHIVPGFAPYLSDLLNALQTISISHADVARGGTQLKMRLVLENGHVALFKPKWYEVDKVIEGTVYSGKDRFHGEIISFHLARLLKLNRVPIVTYRKLDIFNEIFPIVSSKFNNTFSFVDGNVCFYGACYHCKKDDPVCGNDRWLEGSIILWLPDHFTLKIYRHPWQRTYTSKPAMWETRDNYCHIVRNSNLYKSEELLLDLIEVSIFDFLIGNGDRHHYETIEDTNARRVLLIDNGKSFGNPDVDHIDILAPLYQCCRLRKSFLTTLVSLKKETLSKWLKILLKHFSVLSLLAEKFYLTLDRRLDKALSIIAACISRQQTASVLVS